MTYIYDITLNFNETLYDFFEWNSSDSLKHIRKIPIFKVSNDTFLNMLMYEAQISDDILRLITDRSRGHLRDAHMLLDEYLLLGEEEFRKVTQSSEELYYKLILAAMKNDIVTIQKIIGIMQSYPLYILKQDYEMAVLNIIKVGLRVEQTTNKYLAFLVSLYKERIFTIIDILNKKEIYEMFTSDKRFQAAMYLLVANIRNLQGRWNNRW